MRISKHFTLQELLRSNSRPDLAERVSDNELEQAMFRIEAVQVTLNLSRLTFMVLQPLRDRFGPVLITSGYRPPALNEAVGGSNSSTHLTGRAADIVFQRTPAADVWAAVMEGKIPDVQYDRFANYVGKDRFHVEVPAMGEEPRRLNFLADPNWRPA